MLTEKKKKNIRAGKTVFFLLAYFLYVIVIQVNGISLNTFELILGSIWLIITLVLCVYYFICIKRVKPLTCKIIFDKKNMVIVDFAIASAFVLGVWYCLEFNNAGGYLLLVSVVIWFGLYILTRGYSEGIYNDLIFVDGETYDLKKLISYQFNGTDEVNINIGVKFYFWSDEKLVKLHFKDEDFDRVEKTLLSYIDRGGIEL